MKNLPESIRTAWANRDGPIVLATVDAAGIPNAIYATCAQMQEEDAVVVADNYFHKTRANIAAGSKGSLLFITKEGKSYQLKGRFEYHTSGAIFDAMKQWNPARLPGVAAVVLRVEEVYSGAERIE
jgi:hypothetical protein